MSDNALQIGDRVRAADGRDYTILTVTELHYGLVDEERDPIIDEQNGQQCAHIAVRKETVRIVPLVTAGPAEFGPDGFTVSA